MNLFIKLSNYGRQHLLNDLVLSERKQQRIQDALKAYWLSPFCTGTILLGEPLLSWALEAEMLASKAYADAFDKANGIAYQIKTGQPKSPVTFARLTTPSQFQWVNANHSLAAATLGDELLYWVRSRIEEPKQRLNAVEVRVARLIYTVGGQFIYYERHSIVAVFDPSDYQWQWSAAGNALQGYRNGQHWFSWYPQGRQNSKNQNQLHFHGENALIPTMGSPNRMDFTLGQYGQISFDRMLNAINKLLEDTP
jgi:hypothetical protein